jgi:hypothetical protein
MESQGLVPHPQRAGTQLEDQAAKALGARQALGTHSARGHQLSVVHGLHARPALRRQDVSVFQRQL